MYKYAYLMGDLLLAFVWLIFYFRRKDLRYEMIMMSLLTLFWIGISFFIFAPDFLTLYWNPEGLKILHLPLGILGEDVLYAFLLGGGSCGNL